MPKTIEKLTPYEKAHISRQMILKWHRAKRKEKLLGIQQELREAYKAGKSAELAALRKSIIENTKRDLKRLKKMSDKEAEKKATEFADQFIKVAKGEVDIESILKKQAEVVSDIENTGTILDGWIKEKGEVINQDFKYLALNKLGAETIEGQEAFILLGLIERYWGKKEVKKQYEKLISTKKLKNLRSFFNRDNTEGKIGFYYGERKVRWDPKGYEDWDEIVASIPDDVRHKHDYGYQEEFLWIKGWWAHDIDDNIPTHTSGGADFPINQGVGVVPYLDDVAARFDDVLKVLKGSGYGDEWLGKNLLSAVPGIHKELKSKPTGDVDSGLGTAAKEQELLTLFKKLTKRAEVRKSIIRNELYLWFRKHTANKWVSLDEEKSNWMALLFGGRHGIYRYRYVHDQKKIYWLKMSNAKLESGEHEAGYITIKDKKIHELKNFKSSEYKQKLQEEILGKMTSKELQKESVTQRVKHKTVLTVAESLAATKGLCVKLRTVSRNATTSYEELDTQDGYLDKLETALVGHLKKKFSNAKAEELAVIRREYVYEEINKALKDKLEYLKENPEEKIVININSKDKVRVKLKNRRAFTKFLTESEDFVEDTVTSAKDMVKSAWEKFEKKVGSPIIAWVLDKVLGIRKG